MKITLWTYQKKEAVEVLKKNGVLRLSEEDRALTYIGKPREFVSPFISPYNFMIHEMKEQLPPPKDSSAHYPIWAWYKLSGRYHPSKKWDKIHEGKIRLKLEIDSNRLLLSDFDRFCALISGLYLELTPEDKEIYGKRRDKSEYACDPDEC